MATEVALNGLRGSNLKAQELKEPADSKLKEIKSKNVPENGQNDTHELENDDHEVPLAVSDLSSNFQWFRVTPSEVTKEVDFKPVMWRLVDWLNENELMDNLEKCVDLALKEGIKEMEFLRITDAKSFLVYVNKMLSWVPKETFDGKDVYYHIVLFYFVLNQPPLIKYQTPVRPNRNNTGRQTWLTKWLVDYAVEVGSFCDDPKSITKESLETFRHTPSYKVDNYIEPRGGWQTFNQFFAREIKPGYRTIYGLCDPSIVVSPADCTFGGSWHIDSRSHVTLKHLQWNIVDLLQGSRYSGEFNGGVFTHSFLNTFDYHRLHTPVEGKVLESYVIQGQVYLETGVVKEHHKSLKGSLVAVRTADAPNSPGYQFVQTRGLTIIDSPIGLVAVLPIGMATVSSVIMTADEGVSLRKGEEIGYFQFGGSDIVMVFQAKSKVAFTAVKDVHLSMGMPVATAKVQP